MKINYFCAVLLSAIVLVACKPKQNEPVLVDKVTLDQTSLALEVGETATLSAKVTPTNATYQLAWSSSNTEVATVVDGVITALSVGDAVITATADGKTATCDLTVSPLSVKELTVEPAELTLLIGETATLSATVTPAEASYKFAWSSSNTTVATVADGVIAALSTGDVVITVAAGGKTATCSLTVNDPSDPAYTDKYAVDLGLPSGTKWANMNVGATTPVEDGNYYAWGETATKETYTNQNAVWYDANNAMTAEKLQAQNVIDANGNLTAAHDVATVVWGEEWRLPTADEIEELSNTYLCNWEWVPAYGEAAKPGFKITGPNGRYIFLPASGSYFDNILLDAGKASGFWGATVNMDQAAGAHYLSCTYTGKFIRTMHNDNDRCMGRTIRAVAK